MDALLFSGFAALPNMHPAVVHFPIALLLVAPGFDVACLFLRRQVWLDRAAAALYALGALGAGAAYLTGRQAEDGLINVAATTQPLIAQHADWALRTLLFFAVVAVVRLAVAWRDRRAEAVQLGTGRLVVFAIALAGPWLLFQTADRGGLLVYRHGLAVMAAADGNKELPSGRHDPAAVRQAPASPPVPLPTVGAPSPAGRTSGFEHQSGGSLRWQPVSGDREAIGRDLKSARGSPADAVQVAASATAGEGIELSVSRRALLVLPGSFGDVEVSAELDIERFRGAVGLAHHVKSADEAEVFVVSTTGVAALKRMGGTAPAEVGSARVTIPRGLVKLSVSSAGTHFKGAIAGRSVVHGHGSPTDGDAVGLFFDGVGVVGVRRVHVTPLPTRR